MKDYEIQTNMYSYLMQQEISMQNMLCKAAVFALWWQVIGQLHLEIHCVKAQFTGARLRYIFMYSWPFFKIFLRTSNSKLNLISNF
jgi:hypothetical protein